jgi:hypothetical protein
VDKEGFGVEGERPMTENAEERRKLSIIRRVGINSKPHGTCIGNSNLAAGGYSA